MTLTGHEQPAPQVEDSGGMAPHESSAISVVDAQPGLS
jgi:hypothetical protein